MAKSITLTKGKFALISDGKFELVSKHKWRACFSGWKWYAASTINGKNVYLHRFILGINGVENKVDHIDGDGLNCQDENLRVCTNSQNGMNRGKQIDNKSGYKGVCWDAAKEKWMASIKLNKKAIFLGRFDDILDAAHAYDDAAKKYHGSFAKLNFSE